jgi:hypothetical protein
MARNNRLLSMKRVLLAALMLGGFSVQAQRVELGVGGGFSTNTAPQGNILYKSDQSLMNYGATMKLMYTAASHWQFGVDAHLFELSGKSSQVYTGYKTPAPTVGGDNKKIVYAKYASTWCFDINRAFFFTEGKGYFYVGAAIGYANGRNNPIDYTSNESYNAPDGGHGLAFGGQLGIVKDLSEKVAFNFDVAVRHMDLEYRADAPWVVPAEDLKYSLVTFPVTIGIRYYLFRAPWNVVPRSGPIRPKGRAMY